MHGNSLRPSKPNLTGNDKSLKKNFRNENSAGLVSLGNINNHGGDSDIAKLMTRKIEKQSSFWFFEKKPSAHCLPWISHLITFNYSLTLVRYDPRQTIFHQSERFRFHWRFISQLAECMHAVPGILPYDSYTQGKLFTTNYKKS